MTHEPIGDLAISREPGEKPGTGRYLARLGAGLEAVLEYSRAANDVLSADRTFTPTPMRGRGIAGRLVARMAADARREGFRIRPACPYVTDWFDRHPDAADVRAA